MEVIDLRSDTVTQPTAAMRETMALAEVGDDVMMEDPTIKLLQSRLAALLGKEDALFVPTGTMGNLVSLLTHCQRGQEIIAGSQSHIFLNEQGGSASLGGIHCRTAPNQPDGTISIQDIKDSIRGDDVHFPITRLIALEQTHNFCGGRVLPLEYIDEVCELAHSKGLVVHVDGSRLFNAVISSGISAERMMKNVDSVNICLSKGLACPAGSVIVGSSKFIAQARRWRKAVGGGMRQAGVLAACGIVALDTMIDRLAEDHANARAFATAVSACKGLRVSHEVDSNIVILALDDPRMNGPELKTLLKEKANLLTVNIGERKLRAVFHYHISAAQATEAAARLVRVVGEQFA